MYGFFTNKLTALSNNYIDWSRAAELIASGNHRYTHEQILIRSAIVATTAVSGFLGAYYNDSKKTQCSDLTIAIATSTLGFLLSHAYVAVPLINKRRKISQECDELIDEIKEKAKGITTISHDALNQLLDKIVTLSLADEKAARASQTWGYRKRLLTNLNKGLAIQHSDLLAILNTKDINGIMQTIQDEFESNCKLRK